MGRRKTKPAKRERITKDHRRNLSRDRAQEKRRLRRNSNERVRAPRSLAENDGPLLDTGERLTNWRRHGQAVPLEEHVESTLAWRIRRTAWNCFKRPYSAEGREKFKWIAISLMQGRTEKSSDIARLFHDTIYGEHSRYERVLTQAVAERQAWILCFLRDEPSVGGEFKKWIRDMLARHPEP